MHVSIFFEKGYLAVCLRKIFLRKPGQEGFSCKANDKQFPRIGDILISVSFSQDRGILVMGTSKGTPWFSGVEGGGGRSHFMFYIV